MNSIVFIYLFIEIGYEVNQGDMALSTLVHHLMLKGTLLKPWNAKKLQNLFKFLPLPLEHTQHFAFTIARWAWFNCLLSAHCTAAGTLTWNSNQATRSWKLLSPLTVRLVHYCDRCLLTADADNQTIRRYVARVEGEILIAINSFIFWHGQHAHTRTILYFIRLLYKLDRKLCDHIVGDLLHGAVVSVPQRPEPQLDRPHGHQSLRVVPDTADIVIRYYLHRN